MFISIVHFMRQFLELQFLFILDRKIYHTEVNIKEFPSFYISKDWECKVYEGLATYKINGMKAWGVAEWQYRNIQGKEVQQIN